MWAMTVVIVIAVVIAKVMAMARKIFFINSHLLICGFSEQKCGDSSSAPIQLAQMTRWLRKSFFIMVTCRNAR